MSIGLFSSTSRSRAGVLPLVTVDTLLLHLTETRSRGTGHVVHGLRAELVEPRGVSGGQQDVVREVPVVPRRFVALGLSWGVLGVTGPWTKGVATDPG